MKGQSLIEVLMAVMVIALVLTSVAVAVLVSLKSSRFSKHRTRSTFLSQEAMEWLRGQRGELGWGDFSGYASSVGAVYCLKTLTLGTPGDCNLGEQIDGLFFRSVNLKLEIDGKITSVVTVKWDESGKEFISQIKTSFAQWEIGI